MDLGHRPVSHYRALGELGVMGSVGHSVRERAHNRRIIAGETSDISLPTLLHLLEIESVHGRLHLGKEATIRLYQGSVVDATFGAHRGLAALREILFRESWSFEVILGPSAPGQAIERLPMIIMDAFHLRDEWSRIAGVVYRLVGDQRWCPTGAEVDVYMDLLDGVQELRTIVAKVGAPTTLLVERVLEALTLGLIEKVDAPLPLGPQTMRPSLTAPAQRPEIEVVTEALARPGPTPEEEAFIASADFDDLLGFARKSMRRGDLATVEAAVRAALLLDPESRIAQQNLRRVLQLRAH